MWKMFPMVLGSLLLIAGGLTIVSSIFDLRLPIGKIVFALLLIWIGVSIITGPKSWRSSRSNRNTSINENVTCERVTFGEKSVVYQSGEVITNSSYEASFGALSLDLREGVIEDGVTTIKLNASFGGINIYAYPTMPIKITADCSFGGVNVFGEEVGGMDTTYSYESDTYAMSDKKLEIVADCSFGGIEVRDRAAGK